MVIPENKDPFGRACYDYLNGARQAKIQVYSDIAEADVMEVAYLFRGYDQMPPLEQQALGLVRGRILDAGGGAGPHALHLQKQGFDVTAIDSSPFCVRTMQERGIGQVVLNSIFDYEPEQKFDTILLLMNGLGMAGKVANMDGFFRKLHALLNEGGQVIGDSSDLSYLYTETPGAIDLMPKGKYHGEIVYRMKYKNLRSDAFPWLFIDQHLFRERAEANGFRFELLGEGEHYDYLCRIVKG